MRFYKVKIILITSFLVVGLLNTPARANTLGLVTAADKTTGYSRALFKHWIDADKNGCDTRAEVLLEEASTTPQIGTKCKLTGGKWLSSYDGKTITNASLLDVDHMVPLAEAWRSGAWKWSNAQRQSYANDLEDGRALIAVTLSTNRSKGDKDPALWMPQKDQCKYVENWISIKLKYSLTADAKEAAKLTSLINKCGLGLINVIPVAPEPVISYAGFTVPPTQFTQSYAGWYVYIPAVSGFIKSKMVIPVVATKDGGGCFDIYDSANPQDKTKYLHSSPTSGNFSSDNITILCLYPADAELALRILSAYCDTDWCYSPRYSTSPLIKLPDLDFVLATPTPVPTPTQAKPSTQGQVVSPGAFCSPAGAIGNSTSGVTYTCKTSPTDTRNRWRQ